ncbi:MAG: TIGR01459 family HAD-type hydrolase, partial [Alphaproteobacteria bacterium]|nr:TIGR01459 family HAD-type hydrolase [Alphaproteobacteria bacterium]
MHKISKFNDLIEKYDLFLFDLWGVVHDGNSLYINVLNTLKELKRQNKKVHFISNAPRLNSAVKPVLERLGVNPDLYSGITSSGDTCYEMLKTKTYGEKYTYIGLDKDIGMIDDLGYFRINPGYYPDFILCHGYFGDNRDDEIHNILEMGISKNLTMICVNPDLTVINMGRTLYCAGKIAEKYKDMGGNVKYFGKPYEDIYNLVCHNYDTPKSRILAVGDSLYTDILGANNFGIDSCLVTQGIFKEKL